MGRSVKLDDDLDEMLTAMRPHHGRSKSDVVRTALRALQQAEVEATKVGTKIQLTYEIVTRIEQRLAEKPTLSAPNYQVE
jgi:Arc/MetJ-type ribon-helix-helix transcriptional regulator